MDPHPKFCSHGVILGLYVLSNSTSNFYLNSFLVIRELSWKSCFSLVPRSPEQFAERKSPVNIVPRGNPNINRDRNDGVINYLCISHPTQRQYRPFTCLERRFCSEIFCRITIRSNRGR